jgi:hypothetical protein
MNVICIKPTKRLVKDATYKVAYLQNSNAKNYGLSRSVVRIYLNDNSVQTFPLSSFKPTSGATFPQIAWVCPEYQQILDERESTKIDKNLKSGDYVIPLYDSLKTLVRGRKYKVKEVKINDHKNTYGVVGWSDIKIKLEGSERFYSSFNFRKCSISESREIGLSELFDESPAIEKVNKYKRKFDYYTTEEKIKILITCLLESANDRFRNQMDIIDWCINKTSKQFKLTREDFDVIKDLTVTELLNNLT